MSAGARVLWIFNKEEEGTYWAAKTCWLIVGGIFWSSWSLNESCDMYSATVNEATTRASFHARNTPTPTKMNNGLGTCDAWLTTNYHSTLWLTHSRKLTPSSSSFSSAFSFPSSASRISRWSVDPEFSQTQPLPHQNRWWKSQIDEWELETGNWNLKTENWKLETGNWHLENENLKLRT